MRPIHLPMLPHWLEHPLLKWSITLLWTSFFFIVLIQSTYHPVINTGIPPGPPTFEREFMFTSLHIIGYITTTTLWWWAAGPSRKSLFIAMTIASILAFLTEYLQTFAGDRNVTITDVMANLYGISVASLVIWQQWLKKGH